jgi:ABC-type uncharacterized transport system ATPase subunit
MTAGGGAIKCTAKANTTGRMAMSTMVCGRRISVTGRVYWSAQAVIAMKVVGRAMRGMGGALLCDRMAASLWDDGRTASS